MKNDIGIVRDVVLNALPQFTGDRPFRTHAMRVLQTELQRARRQVTPFALIMLDLDHFKAINDTHGHLCGDAMLGQRIRDVLRNSDTKCRYGGEEFMVL